MNDKKADKELEKLNVNLGQRHYIPCPNCGKRMKYAYLGEYVCEECGQVELDDYGKIRKYLDEYGPSTSVQISQATGVKMNVIDEFLKMGRLEIVPKESDY